MNELQTIFDGLKQEQKDHLMQSFDKMECCILEYEPGKFLGCHLATVESFYEVLDKTEFWFYGNIKPA